MASANPTPVGGHHRPGSVLGAFERSYRIVSETGRTIDLFIWLSWLIVGALVVLILRMLALGQDLRELLYGAVVSVLVLLNLLVYRRRESLAVLILQSVITISIATSYVLGGVELAGRFWILPYPFISLFLLNYRRGRWWTLAMFGWVALLTAVDALGIVSLPYPADLNLSFVILFGFMTAIALLRGLQVDRQYAKILSEARHEESLEHEYKKFKMAVDNAVQMIVITNAQGVILYANPATETLTGFRPDEAIGQKAGTKQLWGGLMAPDFYQRLWETISQRQRPFTDTVRNRKKNGEEYLAKMIISPVFDERQKIVYYVASYEDITREQAVEDAKTEFVSIASHQLQTPISAIGWLTELLTGNVVGRLSARQREVVEKIEQSNRRMVDLVNALLNTSRIDVGTFMITPEPTDIAALLHDVVAEAQIHPPHNVTVTEEYDPKTPPIPADPMLLRTICQNLILNALRYTPDNGQVFIRLKNSAEAVTIEVSDTGIGIPANSREQIFKKFYRAPNAMQFLPEGIGLGLYITKSIVEASGGTISFSSTEGRGTTFQVRYSHDGMRPKSGTRHLALMGNA